jgi:hypothetical protein
VSADETYGNFLRKKAWETPTAEVEAGDILPALFPFQRDIVRWALRRGRAAIFADCGLGKTLMQLEWARHVSRHGRVLILAPLAVAAQTVQEGRRFGIEVTHARCAEDARDGVNITNYEMLHKFDASEFVGVVLDESSILKAFDGATKQLLIDSFAATPYRLACTATPAPNDHVELGNHAEFLGIMTRVEMLASFFVHDNGETSVWRLKGHAESVFWRWVCSWAVMIRKPSDLGYDDAGFDLPPCRIHKHVVPSEVVDRETLFAMPAKGLSEQRKARRASLAKRVGIVSGIVDPGSQWLVWCELNDEGDLLEKAIDGAVQVAGRHTNEVKESRMLGFTAGEHRVMVSKPSLAGFGMNWQHCNKIAFVGLSHSYEQFYQAVRRCWRFGQKSPVEVHIVATDIETDVIDNIERKELEAQKMTREMVANMRDLNIAAIRGASRETTAYEPTIEIELPSWLESEAS